MLDQNFLKVVQCEDGGRYLENSINPIISKRILNKNGRYKLQGIVFEVGNPIVINENLRKENVTALIANKTGKRLKHGGNDNLAVLAGEERYEKEVIPLKEFYDDDEPDDAGFKIKAQANIILNREDLGDDYSVISTLHVDFQVFEAQWWLGRWWKKVYMKTYLSAYWNEDSYWANPGSNYYSFCGNSPGSFILNSKDGVYYSPINLKQKWVGAFWEDESNIWYQNAVEVFKDLQVFLKVDASMPKDTWLTIINGSMYQGADGFDTNHKKLPGFNLWFN